MIDQDFLLFLIKEKEQQKLTATQEQVKRLDVEIREARRLYDDSQADQKRLVHGPQ